MPSNVHHTCRPSHYTPQIPPDMAPHYSPPHSHIHSSPRDTLAQHVTRSATQQEPTQSVLTKGLYVSESDKKGKKMPAVCKGLA